VKITCLNKREGEKRFRGVTGVKIDSNTCLNKRDGEKWLKVLFECF